MTFTQVQAAISVPHPSPLGQSLRYYIVRPGNIMIPLIPVDQLPFQLQGVPRQLNHQQMSEGGWKFLQETNEPAQALPVQAPAQVHPSPPKFLPPDHKVRAETVEPPSKVVNSIKPQYATPWSSLSIAKPAFESLPVRHAPTTVADRLMASQHLSSNNILADTWRQPQQSNDARRSDLSAMADHQVSLSDSFANIYQKDAQRYNSRALPPSGIEPNPSKKEFCTHWIKTGDCAFTATGCLYKHEMPEPQKLRELGFTQQPKWWKDKSAIRSLTWMQRRVRQDNDEEAERNDEVPTRRVFDPSNFRKHTKETTEPQGLTILRSPEKKPERGVLSKENEREVIESLDSYSKKAQAIPNLIDMDDVSIPAPPPSLEQPNSTSSDSGSTADSSSQSSVSLSPPLSPLLDVTLDDLQEATKENPRCVRRHSEISWSSNDGKIHKQYPKRDAPLKKVSAPRIDPAPAASKKAGLAKSRYATKGREVDTVTKKDGQEKKSSRKMLSTQEKKTGKDVPTLQSQITKLARSGRDKEGRSRNTVGQARGSMPAAPVKQAPAISM